MSMPSLYTSFGSESMIPGSPKHMRGLALSQAQLHTNDIDVHEWLAEIEMGMYADVFLANFGIDGTNYLNRKHMKKIRLQDLPKMGITQYHHAKLLNEHIHHTLEYEFGSPVRKNQVDKKMRDLFPDRYPDIEHVPKKIGKLKIEDMHIPVKAVEKLHTDAHMDHSKMNPKRRRSFDTQVWANIHHLRSADAASAHATAALRDGDSKEAEAMEAKAVDRRRRRSFDHDDKAKNFGDRALHSDLIHRELHGLQRSYLKTLKQMIGAEFAYIAFLHERTRELLLVTDKGKWFRLAEDLSLPGHCAATGTHINVADAYTDPRFNSNIDDKLGIESNEVLCQPLRGSKGGGAVTGVIMVVNKNGGFDAADEDLVASVVQKIAEDLYGKFKELNDIANIMHGSATFIGSKGGDRSTHKNRDKNVAEAHYLATTAESMSNQSRVFESEAEKAMHFGMDVKLGMGYGDTH